VGELAVKYLALCLATVFQFGLLEVCRAAETRGQVWAEKQQTQRTIPPEVLR